MQLRMIYNAFYIQTSFLEDVIYCAKKLTTRKDINDTCRSSRGRDHPDDSEAWVPTTWVEVLDPIVSFYLYLFVIEAI